MGWCVKWVAGQEQGAVEQGGDELAAVELEGAAELVANLAGGIGTEGVIDRRAEIGGEISPRGGIGGDLVGLADHPAAAHAAAGENGREDTGPVVAAGALGCVIGAALADLGGSAEFADHHHEGFIEQAVGIEIVEKSGDALVKRRKESRAELPAVVGVGIPVIHVAHIGLDDRHTGLDEPSRQEERLAEHVASVAIAEARIFAVEVERSFDAARGQHRERFIVNAAEGPADSQVFEERRPGGRTPRAAPCGFRLFRR